MVHLEKTQCFPSVLYQKTPVCSLMKVFDKILGMEEGLGRWKPGLSSQFYRTCYYSTAQMGPGYPQGGLSLWHHITDSESTHSNVNGQMSLFESCLGIVKPHAA